MSDPLNYSGRKFGADVTFLSSLMGKLGLRERKPYGQNHAVNTFKVRISDSGYVVHIWKKKKSFHFSKEEHWDYILFNNKDNKKWNSG